MALNVDTSLSSNYAVPGPFHDSATLLIVSDEYAFPNIVPVTRLKARIAGAGGSRSDSLLFSPKGLSFFAFAVWSRSTVSTRHISDASTLSTKDILEVYVTPTLETVWLEIPLRIITASRLVQSDEIIVIDQGSPPSGIKSQAVTFSTAHSR